MSAFVPVIPVLLRCGAPAITPRHPRSRLYVSAVIQEPNAEITDPTKLKNEHLNAYFDADDSTYQTRLRNPLTLGFQNFVTELGELLLALRRAVHLEPPSRFTPPDCLNLQLSAEAVANREREREFEEDKVDASGFVRLIYDVTCSLLDIRFEGRPIPRFWFLETVARMPYFAYTSCLHLLSTLGWFRSATLMNMHHAEELNEAYHLAVMEALGGDRRWGLIELHAADTYAEFLETNAETLRQLPAPEVAHEYYAQFMYYFYEFQLSEQKQPEEGGRRPQINSLYDVFQNILLDEQEHSRTMTACTNYIEKGDPIWYNGKSVSGSARRQKLIPVAKRQEFWKRWIKIHEEQDEGS